FGACRDASARTGSDRHSYAGDERTGGANAAATGFALDTRDCVDWQRRSVNPSNRDECRRFCFLHQRIGERRFSRRSEGCGRFPQLVSRADLRLNWGKSIGRVTHISKNLPRVLSFLSSPTGRRLQRSEAAESVVSEQRAGRNLTSKAIRLKSYRLKWHAVERWLRIKKGPLRLQKIVNK